MLLSYPNMILLFGQKNTRVLRSDAIKPLSIERKKKCCLWVLFLWQQYLDKCWFMTDFIGPLLAMSLLEYCFYLDHQLEDARPRSLHGLWASPCKIRRNTFVSHTLHKVNIWETLHELVLESMVFHCISHSARWSPANVLCNLKEGALQIQSLTRARCAFRIPSLINKVPNHMWRRGREKANVKCNQITRVSWKVNVSYSNIS